jgi:hypothetical protein
VKRSEIEATPTWSNDAGAVKSALSDEEDTTRSASTLRSVGVARAPDSHAGTACPAIWYTAGSRLTTGETLGAGREDASRHCAVSSTVAARLSLGAEEGVQRCGVG